MMDTAEISYDIHVATNAMEIEKLRPFWTKVNRHPDTEIDSYSLFVSESQGVSKPYVLVATQNEEPKSLLVGRLDSTAIPIKMGYRTLFKLNVRQIVILQEGFLGERNTAISQAMVLQILASLRGGVADRAILCNVDITSEFYRFAKIMPKIWLREYANEITLRWRTELPSSLDEFLKQRSKKHKYWLRRIGRVFEEKYGGQVHYKIFQKKSEVAYFCSEAEKVAQNSYQRGLGVGFINTTKVRRRLELAAEKGWIRAYVIFIGEEPLAFWCGSLYNGVMYLDSTGYKLAYRKYELGTILFLKMVEDLCNSRATEINYGTGTSFYKERFGNKSCVEAFVGIHAPSAKGFFTSALITVAAVANHVGKNVAGKLRVVDIIKKQWRTRLASTGDKEQEQAEPKREGE